MITQTDQIRFGDQTLTLAGGTARGSVGIYAGRVHPDLDIGFVWRPRVLREVLTGDTATPVRGRTESDAISLEAMDPAGSLNVLDWDAPSQRDR